MVAQAAAANATDQAGGLIKSRNVFLADLALEVPDQGAGRDRSWEGLFPVRVVTSPCVLTWQRADLGSSPIMGAPPS